MVSSVSNGNNDNSFLVALSALSAYSSDGYGNIANLHGDQLSLNVCGNTAAGMISAGYGNISNLHHGDQLSLYNVCGNTAADMISANSIEASSLPIKRVFSNNGFNTSIQAKQSVTFSSRMSDSEDSDFGGNANDLSIMGHLTKSINGAALIKAVAPSSVSNKKRRIENDIQFRALPYCVPVVVPIVPVVPSPEVPPMKCQFHKCNDLSTKNTPFCGRHIGIKQCAFSGCNKCAQGSTKFCISHGGGRRCKVLGCLKGARDRNFCANHGGGRRCHIESCAKSAVGGSDSCTLHGGGKKCTFENCTKSAQSPTGFCVRHGGGRKCKFENCSKVARGKTTFCASHSVTTTSYEDRVLDMEKEIVNRLIHLHKEINPSGYASYPML
jgi:hypothetical protein